MNKDEMDSPLGAGGEQRLWDYIDGLSSPHEKTVIDQLLEGDTEWKAKYHELLEVQQLLQSSELEAPSMRFTKNVMEEIAKLQIAPATKNYINKRVIWGIAGFFITLIVGFLVYGFAQVDWTVQTDSKLPVDFTKVNLGKMFNNDLVNAFMLVNVILGLFLLDRFLANKRKKISKES